MKYYPVCGFFGSGKTPCIVFCAFDYVCDSTYYVVSGGQIVNKTYGMLRNGVNVEYLEAIDCFTCNTINSLEELQKEIEL